MSLIELMKEIWNNRREINKWYRQVIARDGWDWLLAHVIVPVATLVFLPVLLANDSLLAHEAAVSAIKINSLVDAGGRIVSSEGIALILEPEFPSFSVLGSSEAEGKLATEGSLRTSLPVSIASSYSSRFRFSRYGLEIEKFDVAEPLVMVLDFQPKGTITIGGREIELGLFAPSSELSKTILLGAGLAALFGFGWVLSQGRATPSSDKDLSGDKAASEHEQNVVGGN